MSRNILYENVDMLDVMEACEDNSKDFIMLYMPTMDGAIEGLFCDKELEKGKNPEKTDMLWPENGDIFYHCYDELPERIDYGNAFYTNKADYDAYIETISKVIQNAGRILSGKGVFCFGVPKRIVLFENCQFKETLDVELMLQQVFTEVRALDAPNYTGENYDAEMYNYGTEFTLYMCGAAVTDWTNDKATIGQYFKWSNRPVVAAFFEDSEYILNKVDFNQYTKTARVDSYVQRKIATDVELKSLFSYELYDGSQGKRFLKAKPTIICDESDFDYDEETGKETLNLTIVEKDDKELNEFLCGLNHFVEKGIVKYQTPLVNTIISTFCVKGKTALFPYDRNGHFSLVADQFGLNWVSLYKQSKSKSQILAADGKNASEPLNFIKHIPESGYIIAKAIPTHAARTYDANFLSSAAELNEMKAQFTKYANLIEQVVECASTGGEETYGDVEQAVHAIISLAVRAREGTGIINGDEAEKWFGEGWELLSEQCRNYLQTAAAYEKLSQQNGNADCAPIAIEFCRALELETNSVVMKPYIDYYYAHGFQDKTYKGNFKTIQKFQGAVEKQRNNSKEGMMLGQIGTCMRNAPDSVDDKNIFYSFKKYCEENDKEQLLDVDVVGEFQLVGKIRNQSAHPSLLDKGCVSQAKQLVRAALKTQLAVETKFAHSTVLTCSVVCSPKGNKIDPNSDKMRKAVANQIEMMAQSGVKIFVLTGKFGFNQIVSDELQKYIKANANKDWGKIMVNNASDKGETSKRQKDALSKAQFCIAYYADDVDTQENDQAASVSATKAMVDDAIKEHGLIVWNAYGIE